MNNNFMKKNFIVLCLMFLSSLAFAGLSVKPSIVNIAGEPGSTYKGSYSLTSTYENPVVVDLNLSNGNSFSGNGELNVEDWLKFEKKEFDLKPGETIDIPYEVLISTSMKGSVCGRLDFSAQQSSMINLSISIPMYVTVEGTEDINFEIDSLNITRNPEDGSLFYKMVIKNTGNVHIRHSGQIQIFDSKKTKEIKVVNIEETVPTFCESSKIFIDSIGPLDEGTYVAVFTIKDLGKQATKEVKFKVEKDSIEKIKSFWEKLKAKWKEFLKIFQS
jgi:hypothetical protein